MCYQYLNGYRLVVPFIDKVTVNARETWNGQEIFEVLSEYFHYNKSDVINAIFGNRVLVNGGVVNCPTNQIKSGEKIKLYFHRHEPEVLNYPVDIIHVNEHIVVVNKPCSIPVHPVGRFKKNTVIEILKEEHPELIKNGKKLKIVHRLDRLVSGVLLLARSDDIAKRLCYHISQRWIRKEYVARVKGVFPSGLIFVKKPIHKIQEFPPLYIVDSNGKQAVSLFKKIRVFNNEESLVLGQPITGRSHQIRVHLNSIGYPIVDDVKYGGQLSSINYVVPPTPYDHTHYSWCPDCQRGTRDVSQVHIEDLLSHQISLHALRYSCVHPKWTWSFETPPPSWIE